MNGVQKQRCLKQELKDAGEDTWESLKDGAQSAWDSLGDAVDSAISKFK